MGIVIDKLTYYLTSLLNKIPNYYVGSFIMSFIIYLIDMVMLSTEKRDFKKYNVNDTIDTINDNLPMYYWISLCKTRKDFEDFKTPYLKFWPNFNKSKQYPDVDHVVDVLFKCDPDKRRLNKSKPNLFFAWFANYWINMFLHTTYKGGTGDNVPYNVNFLFGRPIYGASLEEERVIRSFKNGFVRMNVDNTPLKLSDLTDDEKKHVYMENPKDQNIFISGLDKGNLSVGHYVMQTLFNRNHNRLCKKIIEINNILTDEQIYQLAKTINIYQGLKIVLGPYITAISGNVLNVKRDYYTKVQFNHERVLATWEYNALYQWHNMLPEKIGDDTIQDMMYQPETFYKKNIGEWLRDGLTIGLYEQRLNNALPFLLPVEKQALLASRRANLLSYCDYRRNLKLSVPKTFLELTGGDETMAENLQNVYTTVEDVEFYVGMWAEPIIDNKFFGWTFSKLASIVALNSVTLIMQNLRQYITQVDSNLLVLVDDFEYLQEFVLDNLEPCERNTLGNLKLNFVC